MSSKASPPRTISRGKKKCSVIFGATSGTAGFRLPNEQLSSSYINIRARGGLFEPSSAARRQRLLAEQAWSATEPRARYLTCLAAAYVRRSALHASVMIRYDRRGVKREAVHSAAIKAEF